MDSTKKYQLTKRDLLVLLQAIALQELEDLLSAHVEVLRGHDHNQVGIEAVLHHVFRRRLILLSRVPVLLEDIEIQLGSPMAHRLRR